MFHASCSHRRPVARAGFITTGTLLLAAASAFVLLTGCHSGPAAASAHAARSVPAAAQTIAADTMAPVLPYDEKFYVPPVDDAQSTQN